MPTPRIPTWSSSPSGVPRKPGQTRIDLCQTNVNILKSIASNIVEHAPNAYYIIVSNPVDILTYVFQKVTGVSEKKVIGSGTLLDSARLRSRIAEYLNVSQKNVHAYVFGEHGETSFIPWSIAQVSTIDLFDYKELIKFDNKQMVDLDYDAIEKYMRTSGSKVIQRKGATFYAIAISVCSICEYLFGAVDVVTTVSTMMHGEYGIEDVCLSIPTLLGPNGVEGKVTPQAHRRRGGQAALQRQLAQGSYQQNSDVRRFAQGGRFKEDKSYGIPD